jgi:hypothetical protein
MSDQKPVAKVIHDGSFNGIMHVRITNYQALQHGMDLFTHAMPKSEDKPYQLSGAEQGAIKKALIASTTPQPSTDVSEKPTDAQYLEWCEKYSFPPTHTNSRQAFEDAASLHLITKHTVR